jgi:hypothetical protein
MTTSFLRDALDKNIHFGVCVALTSARNVVKEFLESLKIAIEYADECYGAKITLYIVFSPQVKDFTQIMNEVDVIDWTIPVVKVISNRQVNWLMYGMLQEEVMTGAFNAGEKYAVLMRDIAVLSRRAIDFFAYTYSHFACDPHHIFAHGLYSPITQENHIKKLSISHELRSTATDGPKICWGISDANWKELKEEMEPIGAKRLTEDTLDNFVESTAKKVGKDCVIAMYPHMRFSRGVSVMHKHLLANNVYIELLPSEKRYVFNDATGINGQFSQI